jgi:hypothetical protein
VSTVEERTRAAMDAITETVDRVPLLRLPPPPLANAKSRGRVPSPRRWPRRLAPVAAAAAVLALAVGLVVVKNLPHAAPATARPTVRAEVPPRYYVTLTGTGLLVGDTFTGAKVATVQAPTGAVFTGIAAAADDKTFVVDTEPSPGDSDYTLPRTFYLLRIAPGTSSPARSPARLTRLSIPSLHDVVAIALSGSGREFAVATEDNASGLHGNTVSKIRIYSVTTGRLLHTWSTDNPDAFGEADYFTEQSRALDWIDGDRAVAFYAAFTYEPPGLAAALGKLYKERLSLTELKKKLPELAKQYGMTSLEMTWRRLDVSTGGGDLMADSKVIWSWTPTATPDGQQEASGCQYGWIQGISADGKTVVCGSISIARGTQRKPVSWRVTWLAYSVPTGAARTLYQIVVRTAQQPYVYPLWAGTTGNTIIGEWGMETNAGPQQNPPVGLISNGTFKKLPSMPDAGAMAPSVTW